MNDLFLNNIIYKRSFFNNVQKRYVFYFKNDYILKMCFRMQKQKMIFI